MRDLTKKQKDLLDLHKHISHVDDLPDNVWEELEAINDTEVLWMECNRYLSDNYDWQAPPYKWAKDQLNFKFTS